MHRRPMHLSGAADCGPSNMHDQCKWHERPYKTPPKWADLQTFPDCIPAPKHRASTESSILFERYKLSVASVVFFIPNKLGLAEGRANAALLLSGPSVARSNVLRRTTFSLIEPFRGG
jgi:hypothetical protein